MYGDVLTRTVKGSDRGDFRLQRSSGGRWSAVCFLMNRLVGVSLRQRHFQAASSAKHGLSPIKRFRPLHMLVPQKESFRLSCRSE